MISNTKEGSWAYAWLLLASVVLALIPTVWSSLDLRLAQFFFSPEQGSSAAILSNWWWVKDLNAYTPSVFRGLVVLALALCLATYANARWQRWRLPLAFVALAGIAGPGLAVNGVVKPLWERARPSQIVAFGGTQQFSQAGEFAEECNNDCSFVSGHTSCGFFLCSLCLLTRRRRAVWIAIGIVAGLAIGMARVSAMAHWLSDVLWAFPVTLLSSWFVWLILKRPEWPTSTSFHSSHR